MGVGQACAPPVAATQVQLLAVVLKDVQRVRREVVLVPRVEQDRFHGIQLDVGPNEEQVVRLAVRLVVEPLDPDNPCRKIRILGLQRDRVVPAPLAEGLDLGDQRGAVLDGPVPTPACGAWEHCGSERDEDERHTHQAERDRVPLVTDVFRVEFATVGMPSVKG